MPSLTKIPICLLYFEKRFPPLAKVYELMIILVAPNQFLIIPPAHIIYALYVN